MEQAAFTWFIVSVKEKCHLGLYNSMFLKRIFSSIDFKLRVVVDKLNLTYTLILIETKH